MDWLGAVDGDLRGLRVAYSPDLGYAAVDPAVWTVVDQAVTVFERDLGCTVERADPGWEDPYQALLPLIVCESDLAGLRRLADELGERMSPHLAEVLHTDWTAEQLTSAVVGRQAVYNAAWRFFRSYDLLLTPTLAVPPFEHGLQGPATIDGREDGWSELDVARALAEGAADAELYVYPGSAHLFTDPTPANR
jgi:aspartyl-tRNA(Asn)/glutamyl-tRNA(Gln) amidotransferase subunit A